MQEDGFGQYQRPARLAQPEAEPMQFATSSRRPGEPSWSQAVLWPLDKLWRKGFDSTFHCNSFSPSRNPQSHKPHRFLDRDLIADTRKPAWLEHRKCHAEITRES